MSPYVAVEAAVLAIAATVGRHPETVAAVLLGELSPDGVEGRVYRAELYLPEEAGDLEPGEWFADVLDDVAADVLGDVLADLRATMADTVASILARHPKAACGTSKRPVPRGSAISPFNPGHQAAKTKESPHV